jgi:hypothetical protein
MTKRKYPSELNTKMVRAFIKDAATLKTLSEQQGITIAEVIEQLIKTVVLKCQI